MDLNEEIERLRKLKSERLLQSLAGKIHRAEDYFAQKAEQAHDDNIIEMLPGAERVETPYGQIVRNTVICEARDEGPGAWVSVPRLESARRISSSHLTFLSRDPAFGSISMDQIAFVDVETTGLAGGTGTYPFLIGVGYFRESAFHVEQIFMEDYPFEGALLHEVAERVRGFRALVTYNGKTFDLPLLRTRCVLNRLPSQWEKPHIDLLYLARRLWRKRLPECSLGCVEREILRIERANDIDPSFIPRIYFDYTRGVRRDMMVPVFAHNAQDVASMAALLVRLAYYLDAPECDELAQATDLIGLSTIYELNGMVERAVECMERALLYAKDEALSHLISAHIAKIYKRQERWTEAIEIWHAQIETKTVFNLDAFVELAKYYEHREKNHHAATAIVEKALRYLEASKELDEYMMAPNATGERFDRLVEALDHRLKRLRRRLETASSQDDE